jgi:hypothetical protein
MAMAWLGHELPTVHLWLFSTGAVVAIEEGGLLEEGEDADLLLQQ